MVAIVYNIGWLVRRRTLLFGTGTEKVFENAGVDANADFSDPPFEYLFEMACRKLEFDPLWGV